MVSALNKRLIAVIFAVCMVGVYADSSFASQPPADMIGPASLEQVSVQAKPAGVKECKKETVVLAVGEKSIVGWVGNELVSLVKRGMQFFGSHQNQPVRLNVVGSQDRGYRVRGEMGGEPVTWKIEDDLISGEITTCDR